MANEEHLAILKKGVAAWNEWREQHPDVRPDLREANLSEANLRRADLHLANLGGANLGEADLPGADLDGAHLSEANLSGANLWGATLIRADLDGANLNGAHLDGANLRGVDLRETDFSEAMLDWTFFADVDVSTVKGLETVRHRGPSTIGVDTIYRSKGKIPEVFLRGAGPTSSSPTSVPLSAARLSSTPASSAIRARTRSLLTVCMKACRIKACAAGLRLTMLKAARNSTSRLTRPSACMTSCS
jgi:Pentapeptide repeats (8 copies)